MLLHAAGQPVRPVPLVVACAVLTTLLGTAAVVRERLAARRAPTPASLPAQRNGSGSPTDQPDGGPSATDRPDSGPSATGPSATDENPASGYGHPPTTDDPPSRYAESAAPEPGYVRTTVAVAVPVVLAVAVGTVAVRAYLTMPSPAEPGYLSVALNGWAADIDRPVTVPRSGLVVPVRVASAGLDDVTAALRLRVGGRVVTTKPLTVTAETVRSVGVYVPALPADGCLHAVDISIGATSTGFYARGAALTVPPAVPGRIAGAVPAGAAGSIARPRGAAVTVPPAVPGRIAGAVPAGAAGSIARPAPAAGVRRAAC
ncbi:hypothetical protein [Actinoplanes utahensis]|uniref:Uncharacterized protein n=1 Tax=Actinoplanes utahensis TaxID=1869 RepID=A0A0A6UEU6_ACTUT|nr:hypothetical protein [Actinoplanes utahensis]KHD74006.1 hypothetical protein MB27_31345 [Actinoplanes utahensis]